jgi:hypothetical protein
MLGGWGGGEWVFELLGGVVFDVCWWGGEWEGEE